MIHENNMPIRLYGNSPKVEQALKLDEHTSRKIAAIIIYSGDIEYFLELAIWKLKAIDPKGLRPITDAKNVTDLIKLFESCAPDTPNDIKPHWIHTWAKAARSAYIIRNTIAHGVSNNMGETITFMRNPRWHGEVRKREFGDFWCDSNSLDMTADSFATLRRMVASIAITERTINEIGQGIAIKALNEASSVLGEFAQRAYNPSFEKY